MTNHTNKYKRNVTASNNIASIKKKMMVVTSGSAGSPRQPV